MCVLYCIVYSLVDSECVDDIEQEFLKVIQRAHQSVR